MSLFDGLRFDADGLITVVVIDAASRELLMVAYMNREALQQTLDSGSATYWSRSRQQFWVKGATSGNLQKVVALRRDCDGDALLLEVEQTGAACHEGYRSCFSRLLAGDTWEVTEERLCDPY
jgi:phosphoribosyl-AMP cyclohydrolase